MTGLWQDLNYRGPEGQKEEFGHDLKGNKEVFGGFEQEIIMKVCNFYSF